MCIPQGTARIMTESSSNTFLSLLNAGQVAFHTDDTELGFISLQDPWGPVSVPLDFASVCPVT